MRLKRKLERVLVSVDYIKWLKMAVTMIEQGKGDEINPMSGDPWRVTMKKMIDGLPEE